MTPEKRQMKKPANPLTKGKVVARVFDFTYPEQVHRLGIWSLKVSRHRKKISVIVTKKRNPKVVTHLHSPF